MYFTLKELAAFTAKHRATILATVLVLSPSDVAAVTAALDFLQTTVALFARVYDLWEDSEHGV